MNVPNKLVPVAALAALALGIVLALLLMAPPGGQTDGQRTLNSGVLLQSPRDIGDFSLVDARGDAFTNDRLHGRWTALFPGFTHCPDICPSTMGLLAGVMQDLPPEIRERWQVVLFSVDPERDTPEVLQQYLSYFSEDFVGTTGDIDVIDAVARDLAVAYVYVPTSDDDYTVDHTAAIVLIDPAGRVAGYLQPPFTPDALSDDLRAVASGA